MPLIQLTLKEHFDMNDPVEILRFLEQVHNIYSAPINITSVTNSVPFAHIKGSRENYEKSILINDYDFAKDIFKIAKDGGYIEAEISDSQITINSFDISAIQSSLNNIH